MISFYTQYDICKLTGEHSTTVGRLVSKHKLQPALTVGVRVLFSESDKDRLVKIVQDFRAKHPKNGDDE